MELDDELCLCFHVTKRKVINFLRDRKAHARRPVERVFWRRHRLRLVPTLPPPAVRRGDRHGRQRPTAEPAMPPLGQRTDGRPSMPACGPAMCVPAAALRPPAPRRSTRCRRRPRPDGAERPTATPLRRTHTASEVWPRGSWQVVGESGRMRFGPQPASCPRRRSILASWARNRTRTTSREDPSDGP